MSGDHEQPNIDTYDIVRESIQSDLMRDLWDGQTAGNVVTLSGLASPAQINFAVVDRDQSASYVEL